MNIQAMMTNVSESISSVAKAGANGALGAAQWLGRSVSVIGQTIADYARKAVEVATPFFASLKDFVIQNKGTIGVAAAGVAVGVVGYALVSSLFSKPSQAAPAPATV